MAGYLFTFSDHKSLEKCIELGFYSPLMSPKWSIATTATLADFVTMQAGDNVYFFSERMVYGIGEVIGVTSKTIVAENYPDSTMPDQMPDKKQQNTVLGTLSGSKKNSERIQRWAIAFKANPSIFRNGVDMDDLLASDPQAFRSLRVFWKRSFIKLDDEENLAFKAALVRKNNNTENRKETFSCDVRKSKLRLKEASIPTRKPDIKALIASQRKKNGTLSSEMMLELALLDQLANRDKPTEKVFGRWDYLNHQVVASPMKAVDYMDRIDVFGYSWVNGYTGEVIDKYLVCELKKGALSAEDAAQTMKYVDWVCAEYANGDYSMIDSFLVGSKVNESDFEEISDVIVRHFITGRRPLVNHSWRQLSLVSYSVQEDGAVRFRPECNFAMDDNSDLSPQN